MSDDKNENLLVSTYIKRHEAVLLEHIRKQLDAEARNTLFEMAVNEQNKLIEDLNNTISSLQDTVEQSLNSVKITTVTKDGIEKQLQDLQNKYEQQGNELQDIRGRYQREVNELQNKCNGLNSVVEENRNLKEKISTLEVNKSSELQELRNKSTQLHNSVVNLQNKNRELEEKLASAENNAITIKSNYELVLKSLEECEKSLPSKPPQTLSKKKTKITAVKNDSEWIDGNEISD